MDITNYTPFIHLETGEYPKYLRDVRADNITKSFAEYPSEDTLAELGYAVVWPAAQPVGDVVEEGQPQVKLGKWVQVWLTRDFTPQEQITRFADIKQGCLNSIRELQTNSLERGTLYTFPDNWQGRIQLRDGDRANLAGLRLRAEAAKAANRLPPETFGFRTYENVTKIGLSADEVIVLTDVAFEKYMTVLGICWSMKDQADSANTASELPQVPPNLDAFNI